jgi:hypothetical protein
VPGVRSWFVRDLLTLLERDREIMIERLPTRVPERLRNHASLSALRDTSPTDTILLGDAEELLLAIDAALGDGSGKVLELAMFEHATRVLSQGTAVVLGDLLGTVARLRTTIERPFVDVTLLFDLRKTDTGFSLTIGIPGQPRSARILRHLAIGAIRAAQRFSREASSRDFRLFGETLGDRAAIEARYRQPLPQVETPAPEAVAVARRPSRSLRVTQPTLSDEVERILSTRRPSGEIPVSTRTHRRSEPPVQRDSPASRRLEPDDEPPSSEDPEARNP